VRSPADIAAWVGLVGLLAAIAWTDIRAHRIPNLMTAALLLGGLAAAELQDGPGVWAAIAGALLGGLLLLAIATAFRRLRGVEGLGLGDVKFMAGAGAWTGWQGIGPTVFVAATTALAWLALRRLSGAAHHRNTPLPFGPYLCIGLLTVRIAHHF
jgi:leader peptidase (prepilin peptidase)/N-methyltransferase